MYGKEPLPQYTWTYYHGRSGESVEREAISETADLILKALEDAGSPSPKDLLKSVLKLVRISLEQFNVSVLDEEFLFFLGLVMKETGIGAVLSQLARNRFPRSRLTSFLRNPLRSRSLIGKWITYVPANIYLKTFQLVVEALEREKIAYYGKVVTGEGWSGPHEELPIIVYVPSALSPNIVGGTVLVFDRVLHGLGLHGRILFKPDLFTGKEAYMETRGYKPYIYIHEYLNQHS